MFAARVWGSVSGEERANEVERLGYRLRRVSVRALKRSITSRLSKFWAPENEGPSLQVKVCTLITFQQLRWRFPENKHKKKEKPFYLCPNTSGRCNNAAGRREPKLTRIRAFGCQRLKESWNMRDVEAPPWLLVYAEQPRSHWLV